MLEIFFLSNIELSTSCNNREADGEGGAGRGNLEVSSRPRILCSPKLMFRLTIEPKLHLSREQNFADTKTYEVATSSRRFFLLWNMWRIFARYRRVLPSEKNSNEGLEGLLSLRRLWRFDAFRRRASRAKRGVSTEGIRTNYRARDDGPGATGIDFPPLHRFTIFSAFCRRPRAIFFSFCLSSLPPL